MKQLFFPFFALIAFSVAVSGCESINHGSPQLDGDYVLETQGHNEAPPSEITLNQSGQSLSGSGTETMKAETLDIPADSQLKLEEIDIQALRSADMKTTYFDIDFTIDGTHDQGSVRFEMTTPDGETRATFDGEVIDGAERISGTLISPLAQQEAVLRRK